VDERGVGGDDAASQPEVVATSVDHATSARSPRSWLSDAAGLLWTIAAAVAVLAPALRPGITLGPFDLLTRFGLTAQSGVTVHNSVQADQIQQFVPWTNLAWTQVHSGHLPLWNPYNVLGVPLAFNWQSGVFSIPALVGYLFPVSFAYTAAVLTKLIIAGTGVYVLCRVLRLGPLAAALGGTAFELSGPMIVHAGWPHTSVTCWAGWAFAAIVGLLRGTRRMRNITMLALAVGFAVYGGHPESLVAMGLAIVVFVVVYLVARARGEGGRIVRPLRDLVVGAVCGFGLGAPLLFPGVQLGVNSVRRNGTGTPAFPLIHLPNVLLAGIQGRDFTTTAYVGVVVLALAVVGTRVSWKRPEVPALVAVTVVSALLTFISPANALLHLVPGGRTVTWNRAVMFLALALAVLAAIGMDALVRNIRDRVTLVWLAGSFAALGAAVILLGVASEIGLASAITRHRTSLIWPLVESVVGLGVAMLWLRPRRAGAHASASSWSGARWGCALFLALETGFLLSVGIPSWSVSSTYFPPNPTITALTKTVGPSLVGYGSCRSLRFLTASKREVGIRPNANIGWGLHEMVVYDPILPSDYFKSWLAAGGQESPPSLAQLGIFCAQISTATQAREFGVRYVLEPPGRRVKLKGASISLGEFGTEQLLFIPASGPATESAVPPGGGALATTASGTLLPVSYPDPASWRVVADSSAPGIVRFRLTNVPGWNATIDGRPLSLQPWADGLMLQARVPAGRHVIELHYWPSAFTDGIVVAAVVVVGGAAAMTTGLVLSRRRRRVAPAP
jgi:hypothetical protein